MKLFKIEVKFNPTYDTKAESIVYVGCFAQSLESAKQEILTTWGRPIISVDECEDCSPTIYYTTDARQLSEYFKSLYKDKQTYYAGLNRVESEMEMVCLAMGNQLEEEFEVIADVIWKRDDEGGPAKPISVQVKSY